MNKISIRQLPKQMSLTSYSQNIDTNPIGIVLDIMTVGVHYTEQHISSAIILSRYKRGFDTKRICLFVDFGKLLKIQGHNE